MPNGFLFVYLWKFFFELRFSQLDESLSVGGPLLDGPGGQDVELLHRPLQPTDHVVATPT